MNTITSGEGLYRNYLQFFSDKKVVDITKQVVQKMKFGHGRIQREHKGLGRDKHGTQYNVISQVADFAVVILDSISEQRCKQIGHGKRNQHNDKGVFEIERHVSLVPRCRIILPLEASLQNAEEILIELVPITA